MTPSRLFGLACIAAALWGGPAAAQAPATIDLVFFGTGTALPIFVAKDKGLFDKRGLNVSLNATPSSEFQMTNLVKHRFQIAQSAIDNFVAYQEGQGSAKLDRDPDLFVFMGGAQTNNFLIVRPNIGAIADLKGKTLAVDSLTTGFAFVLRKMLEKGGGLKATDSQFRAVGATPLRFEALGKDESISGTLLADAFVTRALAQGLKSLGDAISTFGAYQGSVYGTTRSWAKDHRAEMLNFTRAILAAHDWLFDPANRAEAAQILSKNISGLPLPVAEATLRDLIEGPKPIIDRRAAINPAGFKTVLELRSEYGEPKKVLGAPEKYLDMNYYQAALATN